MIADTIDINKRGNAYGLFHVGALLSNIIGYVIKIKLYIYIEIEIEIHY